LAAYSEIQVEQYATFSTTINVQDTTGAALNLFGYGVNSSIRRSYYSETSTDFDAFVSGIANGEITIAMSAANTANLTPGRSLYDVVITDTNGIKTRVVEGIVNVLPGVTRPQ
jgi:hypothetical protein